ncbi:MAG: hypothetical protein JW857_01235 [Bacteroidales bacterium]|nr:hypothetical protein [Bacteroidales bacterium]
MKTKLTLLFTLFFGLSYAQSSFNNDQADQTSKLKFGAYGQIDYNQPLNTNTISNGELDIHRMVFLMGYSFSPKWELLTEIEIEHVKEVFVEQAYLSYKMSKYFNLKGGLLLIPMGYINEYHEPPVFFGVERPMLDSKVVPTTWREIGFGAFGRIPEFALKYQIYLVNGFLGYNGSAKFDSDDAYRGGRQKGAESVVRFPNLSAKIDYNGIRHLKVGVSGYFGKTQSSLFSNIADIDQSLMLQADSSVIAIRMLGLDAQYQNKGFQMRGQAIYSYNKNAEAYNAFGNTDLGKEIFGYYIEVAYDVLASSKTSTRLLPFVRYENFDTQYSLVEGASKNPKSHRKVLIAGISYYPTNELVLKADIAWLNNDYLASPDKSINMGIGFMF